MTTKQIRKKLKQANIKMRHICSMITFINMPDFNADNVKDALLELNSIQTTLYSEFIKRLSFNFFNTKLIKDICKTLVLTAEVNGYARAKMNYNIFVTGDGFYN